MFLTKLTDFKCIVVFITSFKGKKRLYFWFDFKWLSSNTWPKLSSWCGNCHSPHINLSMSLLY